MIILIFLFSLKLTDVFTAQRWLHHQVSRMINVWAFEPSACRDDHTQNAALSTHHVPARYSTLQPTGLCIPSADTSQPTVRLIHKEKSFIPLLWLGSSCTNCDLDSIFEHLTAAHLSPSVLCYHISRKLPTWSSCSENSKALTIKLFFYALETANNKCCSNIWYRKYKAGCCLPPVGHTLAVPLVREPKDPSRHSDVVHSFWVTVGSSCSKLAFWL